MVELLELPGLGELFYKEHRNFVREEPVRLPRRRGQLDHALI